MVALAFDWKCLVNHFQITTNRIETVHYLSDCPRNDLEMTVLHRFISEMEADLAQHSFKQAIRKVIWFGLGYHLTAQDKKQELDLYLEEVRKYVLDTDARKSEASARVRVCKRVGMSFPFLFPNADSQSGVISAASVVALAMKEAEARGLTSVSKLEAAALNCH